VPVRVTGLKETQAAFRKADKGLAKLVREDLKEAAQPVADSGREKISAYRGAKVSSIRPRVTGRSVFVRQSASKVTGKRGDFGALQWRKLAEALDENEDKVREGVEEALDRLIDRAGL
jgi:hypothetical protein